MPVLKKEFELDNGAKFWVRQASGMEKMKIENIQARVFRRFRHFGTDPSEWTPEQHEEFAVAMDEANAGVEAQMFAWIPPCIIDEEVDVNMMTSEELRSLLAFVRGDDPDGAVPLGE